MKKNFIVYLTCKQKASAMMISLFLVAYLSTLFFYWNQTYKVQVSSYRSALETEQMETTVDLMLATIPLKDDSYTMKVDKNIYHLNVSQRKNKVYYGTVKYQNKIYIRKLF